MRTLRFEDSSAPTVSGRHYDIKDAEGRVVWCCDTEGSCISRPTRFLPDADAPAPAFTMFARGRVMNLTYYLHLGEEGERFATLTAKGVGFLWRLLDADEREVARLVDPASMKEKLFRDMLSGSPDRYAVVRERSLVARIGRDRRPWPNDRPGLVRRLLRRVLTLSDWTLHPVEDAEPVDERLLAAAMVLLIEHNVRAASAA